MFGLISSYEVTSKTWKPLKVWFFVGHILYSFRVFFTDLGLLNSANKYSMFQYIPDIFPVCYKMTHVCRYM